MQRISLAVVRFHVESCVMDGDTKGDEERRKQLAELIDIFDRFGK
jgi:DNA-binding FrmR family transcriptional regulator